MKKVLVTIVTLVSMNASADGFRCLTESDSLKIAVYNMVDPSEGTRSVATMIVSDPSVALGNKTIAKFSAAKGTLETEHHPAEGLNFAGLVDLRFADLSRGGEYIMGTRLENVDSVNLSVDFSYDEVVAHGQEVAAQVEILKRNGESIKENATCTRYLKN